MPQLARAAIAVVPAILLGTATIWSIRIDAERRYLSSASIAQVAPIPSSLLPPGTRMPRQGRPVTPAEAATLHAAIVREPLDQRLLNIEYVRLAGSGASPAVLDRAAAQVARLGWRNTPAQQNLIIRNMIGGSFRSSVDRADALLRRRRLMAQAFQMLAVMETLPEVRPLVTERLVGRPAWRTDYLVATIQGADARLLDARLDTLALLARAGSKPSRKELVPMLDRFVTAGRGPAAYALWRQLEGPRVAGAVNDPDFRQALRLEQEPELRVPFDWRFQSGVGFSAGPTQEGGVGVSWNGRGVPALFSQWVPVTPGARYRLSIDQRTADGAPANILSASILCGNRAVNFDAAGRTGATVRLRSDPVPAGCRLGQFTVSAALDDTPRSYDVRVKGMTLDRVGAAS